jgi:hypothetical protein
MSENTPHTIKPLGKGIHTTKSSVASAVGRGTSNKELTVEAQFDGSGFFWVRFYVRNDEIETWFATFDEAAAKYNSLP